ncbi:MAG: hypothetical protein OEV78_05870 [Spirochaetia bacterium]|nr:hypothetical protein [Spirochaetia bacterium]
MIDTTAPTIASFTSTTLSGSYGAGSVINVTVNFSEPVTLTGGTLNLTLNNGVNTVVSIAAIAAATTASATYTAGILGSGQTAAALDITAVALSAGTLRDAALNNANLTMPAITISSAKTIVIDTTAPTITSFSSTTLSGSYGAGSVINVTVNFSEPVTLTGGTLNLTLNNGVSTVVSIAAIAAATTASATYTVGILGSGQTSAALDVTAVALSAGTLQDAALNNANLAMPATTLSPTKTIVIDTTAPTITSFSSTTLSGSYGPGSVINVTMNFSEPVTLAGGTLNLTLNNGVSTVVSIAAIAAATTASATYTVGILGSGQISAALDVTAVALSAGTLQDAALNNANLAMPAITISSAKTIVIDTTAPIIISAETLDTDNNGKIDHYKITFSESVTDSTFPGYVVGALGTTATAWFVAGYCDQVTTFCKIDNGVIPGITQIANDNIVYLQIQENATVGLYDTGAKPDLTSSLTGVTDKAGNILFGSVANQTSTLLTADVVELDKAAPVIASAVPGTTAFANDSVVITMSEAVSANGLACSAAAKLDGTFFGYKNIAGADATAFSTLAADATWVDTATCYQTKIKVTGSTNTILAADLVDAVGALTPLTIPSQANPFKDMALNPVTSTASIVLNASPYSMMVSVVGLAGTEAVSFSLKNMNLSPPTTSSLTITSPSAAGTFPDVLFGATSYQVAVTSSPADKVCSIKEAQFGISSVLIALNVNCVAGYMVGGHFQVIPAAPLDYRMYQGNVTSFATMPASIVGLVAANGTGYMTTADHRIINGLGATLAGIAATPGSLDGVGAAATFNNPRFLATDGSNLYVSQSGSSTIANDADDAIRKINIATGAVTTLIKGAASTLVWAEGITLVGNTLYIADRGANKIKSLDISSGKISDLAGSGAAGDLDNLAPLSATFNQPCGIAELKGILYIADCNNNKIRSINISTKAVGTLSGTLVAGFRDGSVATASFNSPDGIISDGSDLYVIEWNSPRIRRIRMDRTGGTAHVVSTIAGDGAVAAIFTPGKGVMAKFGNPGGIASEGNNLIFSTGTTIAKVGDSGLVGYWPLNGNANDYNSDNPTAAPGNINNGTSTAWPTLTASSGRFGNDSAYSFNGAQYISALQNAAYTSNTITVAAWIKPSSLPVPGAVYSIVDKRDNLGLPAYNGWTLELFNSASGQTIVWNCNTGGGAANFTVDTTKWTHVAAVQSGTAIKLYANGKLISSANTCVALGDSGLPLLIGKRSDGNFFMGSIADVRVYARALNEGELNELAQDALPANLGNTGATGLLSHYMFDGVINTSNALDSGPLGITIANAGGTTAVVGKDGELSGAFSYVTGYHSTFNYSGLPTGNHPRTLCTWVSPNDFMNTSVPVSYGLPGSNNYQEFGIVIDSTGMAWAWVGNFQVVDVDRLPLNTWSHVCAVHTGTATQLFVNGKQKGSANYTLATPAPGGTNAIVLADRTDPLPGAFRYHGKIDDVRIYNNALTADQIRQLAVQVPSGLVARYDFTDNGGVGDTLKDTSGWNNNLTNNGAVYAAAGGRFGAGDGAYIFAGTLASGNWLNTTTSSGFPIGNAARTICAWYKPNGIYVDPIYNGVVYYAGSDKMGFNVSNDNKTATIYTTYGGFSTFPSLTQNNTWNLACVIDNGNNTQSFYVNGSLMSGAAYTMATANPVVYIGNMGSPNYYSFNGTIDDVRVYNRALTANEIRTLSGYHPMQVSTWSAMPAISSLKFHLDAAHATFAAGACAGGVNCVSGWNDQSGVGNISHNFVQPAAANQPIYTSAGINGKPSVSFNGITQHMLGSGTTPDASFASTTTAFFYVAQLTGLGTGVPESVFNVNYTLGGIYGGYIFNIVEQVTAVNYVTFGSAFVTGIHRSPALVRNTPYLVSNTYNGGIGSAMFINGTLSGLNVGSVAGFNNGSLILGASTFSAISIGYYMQGQISELLQFNSPLNTFSVAYPLYTDREIVECYLSSKYSIAVGHPCP